MAKRQILLISAGLFHPSISARWRLRTILSIGNEMKIIRIRDINRVELMDLSRFSAVVVFIHREELSSKALSNIQNYIKTGGGFFGVHSASASFKNDDRWFDLIGGRFKSHGPIEVIKLENCAGESSPFADIPDFELEDELYLHHFKPDIIPLYQTMVEGSLQPLIWQKTFGKGRVFYACPGHRAVVFKNEVYQEVLKRGLNWVCGD